MYITLKFIYFLKIFLLFQYVTLSLMVLFQNNVYEFIKLYSYYNIYIYIYIIGSGLKNNLAPLGSIPNNKDAKK